MNIPTTLVTARLASARESAVAARINPEVSTAVLAEGLPDGIDPFDRLAQTGSVYVARIAPGCPCCIGHLTMRVTLNRLLRLQPRRLFISLASSSHLDEVRLLLSRPPYDSVLALTEVISADVSC